MYLFTINDIFLLTFTLMIKHYKKKQVTETSDFTKIIPVEKYH